MGRFAILTPLAAVLAISCDVFLDDLGELGEPCSGNQECYDELMCIQGTCSETPGLGEDCNDHLYGPEKACEEGLWCQEGECISAGARFEPCRLGDFDDQYCYELYDPRPCDPGLICVVTEYYSSVTGSLCTDLDAATYDGSDCLCGLSDIGTCFHSCSYHELSYGDETYCGNGLSCTEDDVCG